MEWYDWDEDIEIDVIELPDANLKKIVKKVMETEHRRGEIIKKVREILDKDGFCVSENRVRRIIWEIEAGID